MSARFRVHQSFAVEPRSLFVLAGEITEGMVHAGMVATLRDGEGAFSERVHGVEFVKIGEAAEPALTFSYSRPEKLARWRAIDWTAKELELGW